MSAILITPPALEPVSRIEAKEHLKVTTDAEDDLIDRLITTARQQVEKQIDKVLIDQTWKIYLNEWPATGQIILPVAPVTAVVNLRTWSQDDVAAIIDPAHYYADLLAGPQKLILRQSRLWLRPGRIANGIEIEVTAGFGPDGNAVPAPLRTAMLILIAHWFENRQADCDGPANSQVSEKIQSLLSPFQQVRL